MLTVFYVNTVYCKMLFFLWCKAEFSVSLLLIDTLPFKSVFIIKNNDNCIQQECIKLIKSDNKDIYNVTKDLYFK